MNTKQKIGNIIFIIIIIILALFFINLLIPNDEVVLPEKCKIQGDRYNGECLYESGFILNMDEVPYDLPH